MSEQILAGELVATTFLVTARDLAGGKVPPPRQYVATLIVFGALSAVSLAGQDAGDLAAGIGGLVLLSALMSFPDLTSWLSGFTTGPGYETQAPKHKTPGFLQDIQNALSNVGKIFGIGGGGGLRTPPGIPPFLLPPGVPA